MKLKIFENPVTGEKRVRERRFLYIIFVVGLMIAYSRYLPIVQDLYTARQNVRMNDLINDLYVNPIFKFESILLFCIVAVLYCLIRHLGISILITSVGMFVLTQASYIKYLNRRELFRLDDLKLTEAAGMATSYIGIKVDRYLVILLIFFILFTVIAWMVERQYRDVFSFGAEKKRRIVFGIRIIAAIMIMLGGVAYTRHFMRSQKSIENVEDMSIIDTESDRYLVYRFLENDSIAMISYENVEESYAFFREQSGESGALRDEKDYPNVIVIMNESWWNTDNFPEGRVSFSSDPMAVYRELCKKCSSGYLTSNVYGGGTVSSEAEFLTGFNTKYFVSASGIYEDTKKRKLPSLADYFNALDYKTIAIHPYYGTFYSRDIIYESMGFDKLIFEDSMDYKELYSKYISDESLANQIIKEYENKGNEKSFIWALSIANHRRHLKYNNDGIDMAYPISVHTNMGTLTEQEQEDVTNYVNGIYYANLAFQHLVEYFEREEEPVILVMFGDHIPNFQPVSMDTLGFSKETSDYGILTKMYSIPVLVWSNCMDEQISFQGENISYLSEMLLEKADMPTTDMTQVLHTMRQRLITDSRFLVRDGEGKLVEYLQEDQVMALNHFKNIQYDVLYGESRGQDLWKPRR